MCGQSLVRGRKGRLASCEDESALGKGAAGIGSEGDDVGEGWLPGASQGRAGVRLVAWGLKACGLGGKAAGARPGLTCAHGRWARGRRW